MSTFWIIIIILKVRLVRHQQGVRQGCVHRPFMEKRGLKLLSRTDSPVRQVADYTPNPATVIQFIYFVEYVYIYCRDRVIQAYIQWRFIWLYFISRQLTIRGSSIHSRSVPSVLLNAIPGSIFISLILESNVLGSTISMGAILFRKDRSDTLILLRSSSNTNTNTLVQSVQILPQHLK